MSNDNETVNLYLTDDEKKLIADIKDGKMVCVGDIVQPITNPALPLSLALMEPVAIDKDVDQDIVPEPEIPQDKFVIKKNRSAKNSRLISRGSQNFIRG